jgi:hypothetical protein
MEIALSACPSNSLFGSIFLKTLLIFNRNIVHRHEPPVTSRQVKILQHDVEREFLVVDKPGSIVRSFVLTFSNDQPLLTNHLTAGPRIRTLLPKFSHSDPR